MMFSSVFAAILMDVIYGTKIEDANNKHVVEAEAWGLRCRGYLLLKTQRRLRGQAMLARRLG